MAMLKIAFANHSNVEVTSESQSLLIKQLRLAHPDIHIIKPMGDDKFTPTFNSSARINESAPDEWLVFSRGMQAKPELPVEVNGIKIRKAMCTINNYSSTQVRKLLQDNDEFYDGKMKLDTEAELPPVDKALLDYIRTRNLYRKAIATEPYEELQANGDVIRKAYGIIPTHNLHFKKLKGGICNAPVYVYQESKGLELPIGVFKVELESYEVANCRFMMLEKMTNNGFGNNPEIIKNKSGEYLTKIGKRLYSVIEFIPSDANHPERSLGLTDMLSLADSFHAYSQPINGEYPGLRMIRYELHLSRQGIIDELGELGLDSALLQGESWQRMVRIYRFFSTKKAQRIFDDLPKQLINGDHHHENLVYKNGIPYFIDLDSRRYDLRLYDLTSVIRHGRSPRILSDFLSLIASGKFFDSVDAFYGQKAKPLTALEKEEFFLVLSFSYIEFFSWILNRVKKEGLTHEFISHITQRLEALMAFLDLKMLDETRFTA